MENRPEDLERTPEDAFPPEDGVPDEAVTSDETTPKRRSVSNALWATITATLMISVVMMASGRLDSLARDLVRLFEPVVAPGPVESIAKAVESSRSTSFTMGELDIHPDVLFQPYTAGQLVQADVSASTARMIHEFRLLLNLYTERQGGDDNFTIRVVDNRNGMLLEVYEFEEERKKYEALENNESWNWGRIDGMRRLATRNLVQKYQSRGLPKDAITVKWGRKNQVLQARDRDLPFIEYEVRLARFLGLSALVTEIGTVETFNDDRLISPVGARSRYQMMPYVLRQQKINHYRLSTAAGNGVDVYEEWHPLLTMESAFAIAAGYRNAVGHEIPGLSAYHTGPGNLFMVYRMFLTEATDLLTPTSTVMDAYMWAVTTGYDTVSKNSSFKTYSRGYVASAYGSLRATESLPIDSEETLMAERVRMKSGQSIFLSRLLLALEEHAPDLNWGPGTEDLSPYSRFRAMNKHISLLSENPDLPGVPPQADVRLTGEAQGMPVLFFLPVGASEALRKADMNLLDESQTFRFDHDAFGRSYASEMTVWDRQYTELVRDVSHFGFTQQNRRRLNELAQKFEELASANSTHFRITQLAIIRTHRGIWQTAGFDRLAETVSAIRGQVRFEPRPPSELPTLGARRLQNRAQIGTLGGTKSPH
ncbi:MAG: hypothetical protein WD275_01135 [Rhodothermales bacterium]